MKPEIARVETVKNFPSLVRIFFTDGRWKIVTVRVFVGMLVRKDVVVSD